MDYSDIINLSHHTSNRHKHMSLYERAAQFAPFSALTGFDEAIDESAQINYLDYIEQPHRLASVDQIKPASSEHNLNAP